MHISNIIYDINDTVSITDETIMLSSSKEYLQALREGKYLLFLEWPQFIAAHYSKDSKPPDADTTVSLLVFEWLNNGFCEADAKRIALLCAVSDHPSKPIRSVIDYALTAISIAVFQCMLYQNNKLHDRFLCQEELDMQRVIALMERVMSTIEKAAFEQLLIKQQITFYGWVDVTPSEETEVITRQMSSIVGLRYIAEEYSTQLEVYKADSDLLKGSRLSVVKRLVSYLNEQTEMTAGVQLEIDTYIAKIKEMQPADFERHYLSSFAAPSVLENTWGIIASIGVSFFKLLQPIQNSPIATHQPDKKNNP